ncbi:hypothetical protein Ahy_A09g045834 isoform B [Arachis hypogaea]|uniref:Uncharacterized protein n=1 Tax=Arachis hypogaea TaxID=3818 RepID=A0A445BN89_ARAHY|nr:hypothetical protein Ahy_A09g045834 isoform B [Arachis hypogaea]
MEDTANLVVYRNGEIIQNTHERVRFVCQNLFSFVVPCTITTVSVKAWRTFDTMPITDEASMQNMFQIHR